MTCEDGGYLQIGETGYVGASAKMFVVKTDAAGNLDWKREFGSGNKNMGNSALEVEDGYLVCGMLSRNSAILKLNKSTGATIFQRTHDLGGADAFEHLASTDNGILAVGYRNAEDPNNTFFVYGQGTSLFSMPTAICSAATASTSICLRPTGLSQLAMATSLLVGPRMPCNMGSSKSMLLAMCFGAGRLAATTRTIASEWISVPMVPSSWLVTRCPAPRTGTPTP